MLSYFRIPQEYYCILNEQNTDVHIIKNAETYWKQNKDLWFSHRPICCFDIIMTRHSTELSNSIHYLFSLLLQYDQYNRHPCEIIDYCTNCIKEYSKHKEIYKTDTSVYSNNIWKQIGFNFATQIAFKIIHNDNWFEFDEIVQCFTLLAIRHNKNLALKRFALKKLQDIIEHKYHTNKNINGLYLRFLQATIWDIQKYKSILGFNNVGYNAKSILTTDTNITTVPDDSYSEYTEIIDEKFLYKQSIQHHTSQTYYRENMKTILCKFETLLNKHYQRHKSRRPCFVISISGGVDSMLVSHMICNIRNMLNNKYSSGIPFDISCIHISYNNREECGKEQEFLKWWCNHILHVPLVIRDIDEITRNRTSRMRSLYETITRKIRFDMYRYMCENFIFYDDTENIYGKDNSYIVLGHNKDDKFENVFSNISKQIHFDNLYGMKTLSVEDDINIFRPFLDMDKKTIYKCATEMNIPYLKDSTPDWSNRGKMRDNLIPYINNFDPRIMSGIEKLTEYIITIDKHSKMLFDMWCKSDNVQINNKHHITIHYDMNDEYDYFKSSLHNIQFWVDIWFKYELESRPSNKSLQNCINQIIQKQIGINNKRKYIKVNMNKIWDLYIYNTKIEIKHV